MSHSVSSDDLDLVTELFERMGAESGQARAMAAQLLKRAEQLAAERSISKIEASRRLLEQIVQARQGKAPLVETEEND